VDVSYDERKLTELIVHVAEQLMTDSFGGATKLNKVLYFADFAHVRKHGRPLTGAEYFKLPHGPAPRRMKPIRERLVSTRQAELRAEQLVGHRQDRLIPLRSADSSVFTDVELETIGEVIELLRPLTGGQVSALSHEEPGWRLVEFGETIPYATAFVVKEPGPPSPALVERARAVAALRGLAMS
jgi:uncharacterized phage-associated protein